ncbi:MAG: hypothetical protein ACXVCP_02810 [Bdellovibrio sp.]
MKTNLRKIGLISAYLILSHGNIVFAGPGGSNGGDLECDAKIRKIANNIEYWVENNGAQLGRLDLRPSQYPVKGSEARPYSYNEYKGAMLSLIKKPLISSCVTQGDKGYPVAVNDSSKICVSELRDDGFHLTCDAAKFLNMNQDLKIQQIHHEFATNVPGLEPDSGPISTYKISSKLGKYTVTVTERQLGLISGQQGDSSAEIIVQDGSDPFILNVKGGKGSIAEEVYTNLKEGLVDSNSDSEVVNTTIGDSQVFISVTNNNGLKYKTQAIANSDETLFEANIYIREGYVPAMEAAVKNGLIEFRNPSLFVTLHGKSDEAQTNKPARLGKHIRCTWESCKVYLNQFAKSELVEAKHCEFHIDRAGKFSNNSNSDLLFVAKVRSDLKDQVASIKFVIEDNSNFSQAYKPLSGGYFYRIFPLLLGPGEGGYKEIPDKGYFLLSLKDGRAFSLHPEKNRNFVIDLRFADNLKVQLPQEVQNVQALKKIISSMPTTSSLYNTDGSARYINPNNCQ